MDVISNSLFQNVGKFSTLESRDEAWEAYNHRDSNLSIIKSSGIPVFSPSDWCSGPTLPSAHNRKGVRRKHVAVIFHLLVCPKVVEVSAWRLDSWGLKKTKSCFCWCLWGMSLSACLCLAYLPISFCFIFITEVCNEDMPPSSESYMIIWQVSRSWKLNICFHFGSALVFWNHCVSNLIFSLTFQSVFFFPVLSPP